VIRPLQQRSGVPVKLVNDADTAALGEWTYGAGRGAHRLAMITTGTGTGTGTGIGTGIGLGLGLGLGVIIDAPSNAVPTGHTPRPGIT
jgi:ROK family